MFGLRETDVKWSWWQGLQGFSQSPGNQISFKWQGKRCWLASACVANIILVGLHCGKERELKMQISRNLNNSHLHLGKYLHFMKNSGSQHWRLSSIWDIWRISARERKDVFL